VTHRLIAGISGWGKSYYTNAILAVNLPEYPVAVVLDYKDEFRGLVESDLARHLIVGPDEAEWSTRTWMQFIEKNPKVVLARYRLDPGVWRQVAGRVVAATREIGQQTDGGALIALDEGHFIAPQSEKVPEPTSGLPTTGRGEGISSIWSTQRLAKIDKDVVSQADERLFGGFTSSADLNKIGGVVDYPQEIHNPTGNGPARAPAELLVDGEALPVRRWKDDGKTVGSEWIYSDLSGEIERRDTRGMDPGVPHYGPEGTSIKDP
jgi:hypothetical protein